MQKLRTPIRSNMKLTGRHWRSALYLFLLGSLIASFIPWPNFLTPATGAAIGVVILTGIIIWTQVRLHYLQNRTRRLERQLHRLIHQRTSKTLNQQSINHLEAEHYFSRNQTRH